MIKQFVYVVTCNGKVDGVYENENSANYRRAALIDCESKDENEIRIDEEEVQK